MTRARDIANIGDDVAAGGSLVTTESPSLGRRNLIMNGAMQVAQRGTSGSPSSGGSYGIDRFMFFAAGGGDYTNSQSTGHVAETGFNTVLKVEVTTADTSIGSGDYYGFSQRIEAQNVQHLQYGTANAKTLTLSFWVKATKTGTQTIWVNKPDATSYHFISEYTINTSDTWEYKTLTIPALTASGGSINDDNGIGLQVGWILKYGSVYQGTADTWTTDSIFTTTNAVNNMDTVGNTFYLTGVQLEVGSVATPFEHRSYGEELAACQRYLYRIDAHPTNRIPIGIASTSDGDDIQVVMGLPCNMREQVPSATSSGLVAAYNGGDDTGGSLNSVYAMGASLYLNYDSTSSPFTAGDAVYLGLQAGGSNYLEIDAEL
jgi:hypothetical protein